MQKTNFTKDELKILIRKHKNSDYLIVGFNTELAKLIDSEIFKNSNSTINLKLTIRRMFSNMEYTNNTLYLMESECIVDKLENDIETLFYGQRCTQESLAYSIVTEILDYYNSNYNKELYLREFDIPEDKYQYTKILVHLWCEQHHWKPCISIV